MKRFIVVMQLGFTLIPMWVGISMWMSIGTQGYTERPLVTLLFLGFLGIYQIFFFALLRLWKAGSVNRLPQD
jgi:hypothetical protein